MAAFFPLRMIIIFKLASGASLPCLLNYPNFPYINFIYIIIYNIIIYIFQVVRRARAVNALRANIIALKTATLVLSCS